MAKKGTVLIELVGKNLVGPVVGKVRSELDSLKKFATSIQGVIAGIGLSIGAAGTARFLLDVNTQFERFVAQLRTLSGSEAAAKGIIADLQKFATETPFELKEVVQTFIDLKTRGVEPTNDVLRDLGNVAAAFGGSIDDVAMAATQAAVGETERLKQFGIQASIQGNKIALTFNGVTQVVERNSTDVVNALRKMSQENFADAMSLQMDTIQGSLSNLSDAFWGLAVTIGQAGLAQEFKGLTSELTDLTARLNENPAAVQRTVHQWVTGFKYIGTAVVGFVSLLFNTGKIIGGIFGHVIIETELGWSKMLQAMLHGVDGFGEALSKVPGIGKKIGFSVDTSWIDETTDKLDDKSKMWGQAVEDAAWTIRERLEAIGDARREFARSFTHDVVGQGSIARPSSGGRPSGAGTGRGNAGASTAASDQAVMDQTAALSDLVSMGKASAAQVAQLQLLQQALEKRAAAANIPLDRQVQLLKAAGDAAKALNGGDDASLSGTIPALDAMAAQANAPVVSGPSNADIAAIGQDALATMHGPSQLQATILEATNGLATLNEALVDVTRGAISDFGSAMEQSFAAIITGSGDAGKAFKDAMVNAIAGVARAKGMAELAEAFAALGLGFIGHPGAFKSAALHTKSAALWLALAGTASAMGGGGGGGASGGGSRSGYDSAVSESQETEGASRGDATVIIEGGILDMNDPKQEEALRHAIENLSDRRIIFKHGVGR